MENTIYSLATPPMRGAIAIIRISGEKALEALKEIFCGEIEDHRLCYGMLTYKGENIDSAMAVYMKAPRTYTREDVAELHIHGGMAVVSQVMQALSHMGLSQAQPGEFTKRAFLNGRIDLTQAEAVMAMIDAGSSAQQKAALEQMQGAGSDFIGSHKEVVLDIIASLDAAIDYPDEDIEEETLEEVKNKLVSLIASLKSGVSTRLASQILEEGYKVAIVGRPNVGKSSLVNAILGKERVIVTDIAGTTRDTLEERYVYKGQLFTLLDTAGIRKSDDVIEQMGIERSKAAIESANIILALFDGSSPLTEQDKEILNITANCRRIIVLNKTDLGCKTEIKGSVNISVKNMENIDTLLEKVYSEMSEDLGQLGVITGSRHINLAITAITSFEEAISAIEAGDDIECVEINIRDGWQNLCEITGEYASEDIIDRIFEKFCLGK